MLTITINRKRYRVIVLPYPNLDGEGNRCCVFQDDAQRRLWVDPDIPASQIDAIIRLIAVDESTETRHNR